MKRSLIFGWLAAAVMAPMPSLHAQQATSAAPAAGATAAPAVAPATGTVPAPAAGPVIMTSPGGMTLGVGAPVPTPGTMTMFNDAKSFEYFVHKDPKWNGEPADPETMKLNAEDADLGRQIQGLAAKYKDATGAEDRTSLEKQISDIVAKQFTVRQSLREKQLAELETQLQRLRTIHSERANQRDRIVADRVQQLLRDAVGLGWGDLGDDSGNVRWKTMPMMAKPLPAEVNAVKRVFVGGGGGATSPGIPGAPTTSAPSAEAR